MRTEFDGAKRRRGARSASAKHLAAAASQSITYHHFPAMREGVKGQVTRAKARDVAVMDENEVRRGEAEKGRAARVRST
jgi:hypothetical protein